MVLSSGLERVSFLKKLKADLLVLAFGRLWLAYGKWVFTHRRICVKVKDKALLFRERTEVVLGKRCHFIELRRYSLISSRDLPVEIMNW